MKVVGLGAGGHAKAGIEAIQLSGVHEVGGLLDHDPALKGQLVLDVPVLGGDELLAGLKAQGIGGVFIGVGSVGDAAGRVRLYEQAIAQGLEVIVVTHPNAMVVSGLYSSDPYGSAASRLPPKPLLTEQ